MVSPAIFSLVDYTVNFLDQTQLRDRLHVTSTTKSLDSQEGLPIVRPEFPKTSSSTEVKEYQFFPLAHSSVTEIPTIPFGSGVFNNTWGQTGLVVKCDPESYIKRETASPQDFQTSPKDLTDCSDAVTVVAPPINTQDEVGDCQTQLSASPNVQVPLEFNLRRERADEVPKVLNLKQMARARANELGILMEPTVGTARSMEIHLGNPAAPQYPSCPNGRGSGGRGRGRGRGSGKGLGGRMGRPKSNKDDLGNGDWASTKDLNIRKSFKRIFEGNEEGTVESRSKRNKAGSKRYEESVWAWDWWEEEEAPRRIPEEEKMSDLPPGVIQGCPACDFKGCVACLKVHARWKPELARKFDLPSAPSFYPTAEEFKDPLKFITSIRHLAEPFGICRVVPPPTWKPPCALREPAWAARNLQLPTRIQETHRLQVRDPTRKNARPGQSEKRPSARVSNFAIDPAATALPARPHSTAAGAERPMNAEELPGGDYGGTDFGFESGAPLSLAALEAYGDSFKRQYFQTGQRLVGAAPGSLECERAKPGARNTGPEGPATGCSVSPGVSGPGGGVASAEDLAFEPSVEDIEGEFWRIVETPTEQISVLYGQDLETGVTGSGFPQAPAGSAPCSGSYESSGWNLSNLARLPGSVLAFEEAAISGVVVPWLYIGMCFSSFCWHVEDHHLYSVNFLHWGAPKVWYGAPGHAACQLEAAMKKHLPHLFHHQPDLLQFLVTQLSPGILQEEGVPVCRLAQKEGEFVITFPRAYHAGFNCGFNCAEAVNVAPSDWLPHGQSAVEEYRGQKRKTSISHDKLLLMAARRAAAAQAPHGKWHELCGPDSHLVKALRARIVMEKTRRSVLINSGLRVEPMRGDFDAAQEQECWECLYDLHLSAVGCPCRPDTFACLLHATSLCSCECSRKTLFFRYSMGELVALLGALEGNSESSARWQHMEVALQEKQKRVVANRMRSGLLQGKPQGADCKPQGADCKPPQSCVSAYQPATIQGGTTTASIVPSAVCQGANVGRGQPGSCHAAPDADGASPESAPQGANALKEPPKSCRGRYPTGRSRAQTKDVRRKGAMWGEQGRPIVLALSQPQIATRQLAWTMTLHSQDSRQTNPSSANLAAKLDTCAGTGDSMDLRGPEGRWSVGGSSQAGGLKQYSGSALAAVRDLTPGAAQETQPAEEMSPSQRPGGPRLARVMRVGGRGPLREVELVRTGQLCMRDSWHDKMAIYPAGFKSRTRYFSTVNVLLETGYSSEIIDHGQGGPVFVVTGDDRPHEPFIHGSINGPWALVQARVNQEMVALNLQRTSAGLPRVRPAELISGLEMFGLSLPHVQAIFPVLDPQRLCSAFWSASRLPPGGTFSPHKGAVPAPAFEMQALPAPALATSSPTAPQAMGPPAASLKFGRNLIHLKEEPNSIPNLQTARMMAQGQPPAVDSAVLAGRGVDLMGCPAPMRRHESDKEHLYASLQSLFRRGSREELLALHSVFSSQGGDCKWSIGFQALLDSLDSTAPS